MSSHTLALPKEIITALSEKKFEASKLHFAIKLDIPHLTIDYAQLHFPWYRKILFTYLDVVCAIYIPRHNQEGLPVCQAQVHLVSPSDHSQCEAGELVHTLRRLLAV